MHNKAMVNILSQYITCVVDLLKITYNIVHIRKGVTLVVHRTPIRLHRVVYLRFTCTSSVPHYYVHIKSVQRVY